MYIVVNNVINYIILNVTLLTKNYETLEICESPKVPSDVRGRVMTNAG